MSPEEMRNVRGNSISMVFQDPMSALNPVYTVGDQIGEAIKLHNPQLAKEEVEKRVEEMLELVGIVASRKNDYPHQFSGTRTFQGRSEEANLRNRGENQYRS